MGARRIVGKVVTVSPAGDLVTDISLDNLQAVPADLSVTVRCEDHQTCGILPLNHDEPEMTLVAVRGSSGYLELQLVGEHAQQFLGVQPGAEVVVRW